DDNVLINGQCVFGYFKNLQSEPIKIKLEYPNEWTAGTALEKDSEGFYNAENYDKIVDSPILLGRLSQASEKVNGTEIDVYTYSKSGEISSGELLSSLKDILSAEEKFLKGLPVKRYAFLFHFQNLTYGAWEHSYSSEYVFREQPLTEDFQKFIRTIVSHEFFHIFTPLNLHSQLVEKFNFERPVMSKHLWLYEGVTEWAANIIELRDSLISLDEYLQRVKEKLTLNDMFDKSLSLTDLAVNSYKLQGQYVNIYQRGAVVAGLLDILLLDLSKGRRGLREVLLDLSKKYGSEKSFDENSFFEEFEKETYPEVGEFFNKYVKGTEKLPVKEYYNKIGIEYNESAGYDTSDIRLGVQLGVLDNKIAVFDLSEDAVSAGLQKGDIVIMVQGDTLSLQNAQQKFYAIKNSSKIGDEVSLTVLRKNSQKEIKLKLAASLIKHQFRIIQNPDTDQLKLRELWLRNL
ncbi:MAG: PDZ domain-containing protein, partial [Bacillota bacterium]